MTPTAEALIEAIRRHRDEHLRAPSNSITESDRCLWQVLDGANDGSIEEILRAFGWTCGPEFWRRYQTDAWVFNLANVVERLAARVRELEKAQLPA